MLKPNSSYAKIPRLRVELWQQLTVRCKSFAVIPLWAGPEE
jgi:hypothetical protein